MSEIQRLLDDLSNCQAFKDALMLKKQALIDIIMTDEIKAKLAEVDIEFADNFNTADQMIADLTTKIKDAVVVCGETVKGSHLMAVYSKGRITWDGKKLDGMMALVPGLAAARKEGEPTVAIRRIGGA